MARTSCQQTVKVLNFCTLFNSNYLSRGLALYYSLVDHSKPFHLYIYPFDDITYSILVKLKLQHTTIVKLEDFETEELKKVKPTRTIGEYCWTCTPGIIKHSILNFNLDHCTYLDSDIYFFDDPLLLLSEVIQANKDVLITPHNYTKIYDQSEKCGIFCVQFMYFKNSLKGMEVLNHWNEQCLDWCFDKIEPNRFGDQKYLDNWNTEYNCIHILKNEGTLAPWNINSLLNVEAIFYHFHGFKILNKNKSFYGWYVIPKQAKKTYYNRYKNSLLNIEKLLVEKYYFTTKRDKILLSLNNAKNYLRYLKTKCVINIFNIIQIFLKR